MKKPRPNKPPVAEKLASTWTSEATTLRVLCGWFAACEDACGRVLRAPTLAQLDGDETPDW